MNAQCYSRVIDAWCAATGMTRWDPDAIMHVDIDGTTVAMMYDEASLPDMLVCHFDLGSIEQADLHRQLLQKNLLMGALPGGRFGVHPDSGHVIFSQEVPLTEDTPGGELPAFLAAAAAQARAVLNI